jgi:predicted ATP-dependent protease
MTEAKKKAPAKKRATAKKRAPAKKKTPAKASAAKAKRVERRQERREKVRKLGLVIAAAIEEAAVVLPSAKPDERKKWVASELNEKLDIPILNEEQEQMVLDLLVDVVADVMCQNMNDGHKRQLLKNAASAFARLRSK